MIFRLITKYFDFAAGHQLKYLYSKQIRTAVPVGIGSPGPIWPIALDELIICLLVTRQSIFLGHFFEELDLVLLVGLLEVGAPLPLFDFQSYFFFVSLLDFALFKKSLVATESGIRRSD